MASKFLRDKGEPGVFQLPARIKAAPPASNRLTEEDFGRPKMSMMLNRNEREDKEMKPSKRYKMMSLVLFLSVLFLLPARSHSSSPGDLRINLLDGDVQIKTIDTGDWVPASINAPLMDGDILWVPEEGRAGIQLRDGSIVRLNENTSLEVLTLDENSYQFYLESGQAYVNFTGQKGSFLQMDTPVSSVRTYDPSMFRVDVAEDDFTRISVFRGRVDAEGQGGKTTVNPGNTLSLSRNHYAELSPLRPPDPWERWNQEKDRKLEARYSDRYLPDELRPYSPDFDENGRWVYVREYGNVWAPTVVVPAGWAPYRVGRWVWMRGDYVWVSYEPWGWAPYHYGRWAFVASIGWFWVPPVRGAVYWGPGFVGWVYTPTYVSWVPLAPREIYYGHGYYGPHSVNITRVNVTNINVTNIVYKNVQVHNAVTVIHHDTFVRGKPVDAHVKENPFLREKISIGSPDIKPERPTLMPAVREIPDKKRPPERIREIRVKETKEKRPLVKQRNYSVLTPGKPVKEMAVKAGEVKIAGKRSEPSKGGTPPEKRIQKSTLPEITGKPKDYKPPERTIGKPTETKPMEKGTEKTREYKPAEREQERPREVRPVEKREMEKTRDYRPPEGGVERTPSRPQVKEPERLQLVRPPAREIERIQIVKPQTRETERPQVVKPQERGPQEKSRELRGADGTPERNREQGPSGRGIEKQQGDRPAERNMGRPQNG